MEKLHYTIVLKSMIGPRSGSLLLQIHGNTVTGTLELLGHRNRFSGAVLQPGKYLISGSLSTSVEKMEYDAVLHMTSAAPTPMRTCITAIRPS